MTLLKLDMTIGNITREKLPIDTIVGGRGMIAYLMSVYASPTSHPLAEETPFIVAPGLLSGSAAPQSGRLSVGGKSPLTGGIKEANCGGNAAYKLGRLGIQAILVTGKSDTLQILKISQDDISLIPADDIVGKLNYDACIKLGEKYGKKVGIIVIGPAGEMKMANSTVAVTDPDGRPSRHAARGGLGAVMAAKGLKAIVIDDSGASARKAINRDAFKDAIKKGADTIRKFPFAQHLHEYGTPCFVDEDNDRGSMPSLNHRKGSFDNYKHINAKKIKSLVSSRGGTMGHGCMPGCLVRCSFIYNDASGDFLTAALEYETLGMLGANLGIDDVDAIARMDRRCDELGIDTIELGCTIGILNDAGLFAFGDNDRAESFLDEIALGTAFGRILGSGVVNTAKTYGIDRIPAVKGLGIPAHAARTTKGWGVTYATSPQGADHTAGSVFEDPLSPEGQGKRSQKAQISMAALDATGLCMFTLLNHVPKLIIAMLNALYGVNWTMDDYLEMGKETLRKERAFNIKAGISAELDRLPDWMSKEPLPPINAVFDVPQEEIDVVFDF